METDKFVERIIELRGMYEKDKTNDWVLIQYLGSIMDYFEKDHSGLLSDLGRQSLALDIGTIYKRILPTENGKYPQKDLVRFCIYSTNAYAVCVMFIGMVEVAYEENSKFFDLHPLLPEATKEDLKELQEKSKVLLGQFKQLMDKFSPLLVEKYRNIYNEEKTKGFIKPIFTPKITIGKSGLPNDLRNAKEMI